MAVVVDADDVFDGDVSVEFAAGLGAEVDAVSAAVSDSEVGDGDFTDAEQADAVTPFGFLVRLSLVVGDVHAEQGAFAQRCDGDVALLFCLQQGVPYAEEIAAFGFQDSAFLEDDSLVAGQKEGTDDPRRGHFVDDQGWHAGIDGGLESVGGVFAVKTPPGGVSLGQSAGSNLGDEVRAGGLRQADCRHNDGKTTS